MTTVLTGLHGKEVGLDKDRYLTTPVGAKLPALFLGASGSETQITATAAEINRAADVSARIVAVSSAQTLTMTEAAHDGKIIKLASATGAVTCVLPAATGSGAKFEFVVATTKTSNDYIIKTSAATQFMAGYLLTIDATSVHVDGFVATSATAGRITMNGTTKGGTIGDRITVRDIGSARYQVDGFLSGSATPFSSAVA